MKGSQLLLTWIILCGLIIGVASAAPKLYLDAYNTSLKLNMHMNGTNGGTVFTDETGKTVSVFGDTHTDTLIKVWNASGYFDGNGDYLSLVDSPDWDRGTKWTISSWINLSTLPSSGSITPIVGQTDSDLDQWHTRLINVSGTYYFDIRRYRSSPSIDITLRSSAVSISTGVWHNIIFSRNDSNYNVYYDGADILNTTNSISWEGVSSSLSVGRIGGSAPVYLNGYIDEPTIWNDVAISIYELYPQPAEIGTTVPPTTTFTAAPTSGSAPLSVQFTETSDSSGASWQWNATNVTGDNVPFTFNTTSGSPVHIFNNPGNYSINLKSTNAGGSNISTQVTFVNVSSGTTIPIVQWFTDKTTVVFPGRVKVNDTSLNSPTWWNYSMGDGYTTNISSISLKNFSYQYTKRGRWNACLDVSNSAGVNQSCILVRVIGFF